MDLQRHVILDLRLTTIQLESQLLHDGDDGGKGYGCRRKEHGLESHIQEHHVSFSCLELVLVPAFIQAKTWLQ